MCEIIGRKQGNGLEVPCCSKAAADQAASQFFINLIKLAFLKAFTLMTNFTENTEFNKRRSQIEAAQNCAMK